MHHKINRKNAAQIETMDKKKHTYFKKRRVSETREMEMDYCFKKRYIEKEIP